MFEWEAPDEETIGPGWGVVGDKLDGETLPSNCSMVIGLALLSRILSGSVQGDSFTLRLMSQEHLLLERLVEQLGFWGQLSWIGFSFPQRLHVTCLLRL